MIQVNKMGDIMVNAQLVLKEVLFVPQFELNLIYVTMLTAHDKNLMAELYFDHVVIRHIKTKNVIA